MRNTDLPVPRLPLLLESLLYGGNTIDALALAGASAALLAVGLLAAFIPARRLAMTDPMIVLREE